MQNAFGQPQSAVVLGGTSDIAMAVMRRLVTSNTKTVALVGRDQSRLTDASHELLTLGATSAPTLVCDASEVSSAGPAVGAAFVAVGAPVDLVIVAVGSLGHQTHDENDAHESANMATINFAWPVAALAEVRSRLVAQGTGRIVVLSSVASIRVRRSNYLYSGAKAGLDRLCDGLADSLVGTGVTLQIIRPAFVHSKMTTGMTPTPMSSTVDEVASAVIAGLSNTQRVIYCPSRLRYVFGVLRHLPAPLWRKVTAER